jgi:hypothetical protein
LAQSVAEGFLSVSQRNLSASAVKEFLSVLYLEFKAKQPRRENQHGCFEEANFIKQSAPF